MVEVALLEPPGWLEALGGFWASGTPEDLGTSSPPLEPLGGFDTLGAAPVPVDSLAGWGTASLEESRGWRVEVLSGWRLPE